MKKIINYLVSILFVISLALLGKFNLDNFELSKYQFCLAIFCSSGIIKFMNPENDIKSEIKDSIRDLIISITIVPLWYWINNSLEVEIFEPGVVVIHFIMLIGILYCVKKNIPITGSISLYIYSAIPLIVLAFLRLGMPSLLSVIIAFIITMPIDYFCYKKQGKNRSEKR